MSIRVKTGFRLGRAAGGLLVLGLVSLAAAPALAANAGTPVELASLTQSMTPANGVAKPDRAAPQRPVHLGRAPYICTPSGFGRTATCFQRAGLN